MQTPTPDIATEGTLAEVHQIAISKYKTNPVPNHNPNPTTQQ